MIHMEISTIRSFLDYSGKIRERTMRVVTCIPPDKIDRRLCLERSLTSSARVKQ
jgi:hypothetical protein